MEQPKSPSAPALRKARLPHDVVGILEDRMSDNNLEFDAYFQLIKHYQEKAKLDEARSVFERLLRVLPTTVR